jgi:hypothetical protein
MPEIVHFTDGTSAIEYTIQEIEAYAMEQFLQNSHRWKTELRAGEMPDKVVKRDLVKYSSRYTPNRYKSKHHVNTPSPIL